MSTTPTRLTRQRSPLAATCNNSKVGECRRTLTCHPVTCPTSDLSTRRQRSHTQATCSGEGNICRLPVCPNTPNTSHRVMSRAWRNRFHYCLRYLLPYHLAQSLLHRSEASIDSGNLPLHSHRCTSFSTAMTCTHGTGADPILIRHLIGDSSCGLAFVWHWRPCFVQGRLPCSPFPYGLTLSTTLFFLLRRIRRGLILLRIACRHSAVLAVICMIHIGMTGLWHFDLVKGAAAVQFRGKRKLQRELSARCLHQQKRGIGVADLDFITSRSSRASFGLSTSSNQKDTIDTQKKKGK